MLFRVLMLGLVWSGLALPTQSWAKDTFEDCTKEQEQTSKAAIELARESKVPKLLRDVEAALAKGYSKATEGRLKTVQAKLTEIQKKLDDGFKYRCRDRDYEKCTGRDGYTPGLLEVNLCPGFFKPGKRAALIVHELAHTTPIIGDPAYFSAPPHYPVDALTLTGERGWHKIADTYSWWITHGFCVPEDECKDPAQGPKKPNFSTCLRGAECISGACDKRCYTPSKEDIEDRCRVDGECKKGKCSGSWAAMGKCVCTSDDDCEGNKYCNEGVGGLGKNTCTPRLDDGAVCTKAHMCKSGACSVRCYTPASKSFGQSCNINAECKKGTCSGTWATPGKCVCTSDTHCDNGQYCNEGVAGIGTNTCKAKLSDGSVCTKAHMCKGGACSVRCYEPSSKNMGQSCNINGECKKGTCSGTWVTPGKCVCTQDSHCGGKEYCNKGVMGIGTNVCKAKKAAGTACSKHHQCTSDCCKIYRFKMQCRPSSKCK